MRPYFSLTTKMSVIQISIVLNQSCILSLTPKWYNYLSHVVYDAIKFQSHRQNKARVSKSKLKSMPNTFFDTKRIVHKKFMRPGQTVNLKESASKVQESNCTYPTESHNIWVLHHNNAPVHTALKVPGKT